MATWFLVLWLGTPLVISCGIGLGEAAVMLGDWMAKKPQPTMARRHVKR